MEPEHEGREYYDALEDSAEEDHHSAGFLAKSANNGSPSLQEPTIVVFGNEGYGLRANVKTECDYLVHIPGQNTDVIDSLNIGVSVGVMLSTLSLYRGGHDRIELLCRRANSS